MKLDVILTMRKALSPGRCQLATLSAIHSQTFSNSSVIFYKDCAIDTGKCTEALCILYISYNSTTKMQSNSSEAVGS